MEPEDAIQRYRSLLEKFPNNELARFSLGKAYYDQADYGAAKNQFELALARKPDWMAVQILLGRCELALGDRKAAVRSLERAKELAILQDHQGPLLEIEQILAELS
jgi:tetratricopeptide (TPR) repeat protein